MRDIIELASELGLGGVELMNFCDELKAPDLREAHKLGELARARGLSLPCFSVGIDIISDVEGAMAALRGYAEICHELEIPYLHHTIALDYKCGRLAPDERQKRFDTGATSALILADYCASLGVRTLIEPQGFVFNGFESCDRLIKASGERIGIVADVGNLLFANESPTDFISAMGSRVRHAHIKDYSLSPRSTGYVTVRGSMIYDCEIGTGDIDLDGALAAFDGIGYGGMYSIEFSADTKDVSEVKRVINRLTAEVSL